MQHTCAAGCAPRHFAMPLQGKFQMPSETTTPPEAVSRSETRAQVVRLARFAILCTLAAGAVLLVADVAHFGHGRFLSEEILRSLLQVVAIEVIAATAAVTCLALWRT
jgi:hypothetical protein